MSYPTPTLSPIEDLATPALLLDIVTLDRNLHGMQRRTSDLGVRLRPHIKTHKCVEIARRQRDLGAHGITVSTLAEARVFANAGFLDLLWAFPLIISRTEEALDLASKVDLGLTIDSTTSLNALLQTGPQLRIGQTLGVWIEIDCGYGRCGVHWEDDGVVTLAQHIESSRHLTLKGCLTHAGHTYAARSRDEVAQVAADERDRLVMVGSKLRDAGIDPGALSLGSTPGMARIDHLDGITEVRPGNYAVYDYTQVSLGTCGVEDCAVSVLASVVSSGGGTRATADCGALALSKDTGPDSPPHYGLTFAGLEGYELGGDSVTSVSQEHGRVSGNHRVGDKLRILPNHSCLTIAQFDHMYVIADGCVVDRWAIHRTRG